MKIEWRSSMRIDDGIIDADHQVLIEIFNDFSSQVSRELDKDALKRTLHKLQRYTEMHFVREERLQQLVKFGTWFPHKKAHQRITGLLTDFERRIDSADDANLQELTQEFANFFSRWLVDHMIKEDTKMRECVAEIRKKQRSMKSLEELIRERDGEVGKKLFAKDYSVSARKK